MKFLAAKYVWKKTALNEKKFLFEDGECIFGCFNCLNFTAPGKT